MSAGAPTRPGRRGLVVTLAVAALVVLVGVIWIVVRSSIARGEVEAVSDAASDVRAAVTGGDIAGARDALVELDAHAASAESLTGDWVWRAAEVLPGVGPNLAAVRIGSAETHRLSSDVAVPMFDAAIAAVGEGRIDPAAIRGLQGPTADARRVLDDASAALGTIDVDAVMPDVREGVLSLRSAVGTATPVVATADGILRVLPDLLGADAPREVLLMLQNNAELRTGGGLSGSFAELRIDDGRIEVVRQANSGDFAQTATPILPLSDAVTTLYSDRVGRFVQNASIPTRFDETAQLVRAWWQSEIGTPPDVVVSVDPIVLRALLDATGPIDLPDGESLDAASMTRVLLVEPYMTLDPGEQNELFDTAIDLIFDRVASGGWDPLALARSLAGPIADGRVSVFSTDAAENAAFASTGLGGPAARLSQAGADAYGVWLNDSTGGKMDTFLEVGLASGVATCRADGLPETEVRVTLTSRAPADAASLPASMTGGGLYGIAPGLIATRVTVSAPPGSFLGGVSVDGKTVAPLDAVDDARPSSLAEVSLAPGETRTVQFRFVADRPEAGAPVLLHTPLLTAPEVASAEVICS